MTVASSLCLVTSGPAYAPIDEVRRITNVSSGELGARLSENLAAAGFPVVCFCGELATVRPAGVETVAFSTNDSLLAGLKERAGGAAFVFHAAALCDFEADMVGHPRKIRSDLAELQLTLRPARKVLRELPGMFPEAQVVGWKYELDGSREDAIARGRRQIETAGTQACVVNGGAYGAGFGFLKAGAEEPEHLGDKRALCAFLTRWALASLR